MSSDSIVSLNVGGTTFQTSPETMVKFPNSKLAKMSKPGKVFFLDHNPKYFEVVLDFLRYGKVIKFEDENFFDGVHDLAKDLDLQDLVDVLETQDIYSMFTLKLHENYHDQNTDYCTIRISRKNLTRVSDSHLARFFSGEQGSQNPLSECIFKEASNRYVIVRPRDVNYQILTNVLNLVSDTPFYVDSKHIGKLSKEMELYGIIEGTHYYYKPYFKNYNCIWKEKFIIARPETTKIAETEMIIGK